MKKKPANFPKKVADQDLIQRAKLHATGANIHEVLTWVEQYQCSIIVSNMVACPLKDRKSERRKANRAEKILRALIAHGDIHKAIREIR